METPKEPSPPSNRIDENNFPAYQILIFFQLELFHHVSRTFKISDNVQTLIYRVRFIVAGLAKGVPCAVHRDDLFHNLRYGEKIERVNRNYFLNESYDVGEISPE